MYEEIRKSARAALLELLDAAALKPGQALQPHVENGLRLHFGQFEALHETFLGLRRRRRGADQGNNLINMIERLEEAFQDMGTGLGLAICRQIAMIFGGRIWVDPTYTGGARFIFAHPIGLRLPEDREHREGGGI